MGKYQIIYADPPWQYRDKKCIGACEQYYSTLTVSELCKLPVKSIAADNSVLFLWTTYPMLKESLELIESWGFTYKTIAFQWVKQNKSGNGFFFGLGRWTRGNTEPCLLATKGKPKRLANNVSQLIFSPLQIHSKKPDVVRDKIVQLIGDVPRIELFARQKTKGWDVWGNEVESDVDLEVTNE